MPLTGDFGKLGRIVESVRKAGGRSSMTMLGKALAEEARTQVVLGFRTSTAPSGAPWAPLKIRAGKPLIDTGRMQNSVTARGNASGIVVTVGFEHAVVHQFGATIYPRTARFLRFPGPSGPIFAKKVRIPARPMLPTSGALPDRWRTAFEDAAQDVLLVLFADP